MENTNTNAVQEQLHTVMAEAKRRAESAVDFLADTRRLALQYFCPKPAVQGTPMDVGLTNQERWKTKDGTAVDTDHGHGILPLTRIAHQQVAERVGIPWKYYERMLKDDQELLVRNVNNWFRDEPQTRMVRTLDGRARAFLSDRYHRIDDWDVVRQILPRFQEQRWRVVRAEMSETRMYIKAVIPRLEGEVRKGDVVQAGVVLSNSEIGMGAVHVQPMIYRLVCLNGMITEDAAMKRTHLGARLEEGMFRRETIQADDDVFLMKVRDSLDTFEDPERFQRYVACLRTGSELRLEDPIGATRVLQKRIGLTDGETDGIQNRMLGAGESSDMWGLINGLTSLARDLDDRDRAVELERAAGSLATNERSLRAFAGEAAKAA